jgi:hypothetical protein
MIIETPCGYYYLISGASFTFTAIHINSMFPLRYQYVKFMYPAFMLIRNS